jgi:sodium/proline symporter
VSLATGAPEEAVTESFDEYEKALDTMD